MTDDDKALVERLRDRKIVANTDPWLRADDLCIEAADRIEAQAAEIERLREALKQIASGRYSGIMLTSFPPKDAAVEAARAALGDTE